MGDNHGRPVPAAGEVSAHFRAVIDRWHVLRPALDWATVVGAFPSGQGSVLAAAVRLGLINCFQWHLEDQCRAWYKDPVRMAPIKIEIDRSNHRRIRAIDEVDRQIQESLAACRVRPIRQDARLALAMPGELLDRLSVLELKHFHARVRHAARRPMIATLEEQIADLCRGFDDLLADAAAGAVHIKQYPTIKMYGDRS
jgi:hypothetical protein